MVIRAIRGPHSLYRRYQAFFERTLTASGLAGLITLALLNLAVYPDNWVLVIGVAIAVLGIRWPFLAVMVATGVMIYPIYTINLYLAVLFVAIILLGHRLFIHYLGATVLVLAAPFLARYHLHWLIPILGGLWWGGVSGAWVGGLAALWGKVAGGMAGLNIDWLVMAGHSLDSQLIVARFQGLNSLETLLALIDPFAAASNVILYNLLQIIGWAVAGGFVGSLAWRKWVKYRTPWSILVLTAGGGLIMLITHLGLPYWLQEAVSPEARLVLQDPVGPLFSLLVVIVVGTTLHSLRESLDLPVAPPQRLSLRRRSPWSHLGRQRQTRLSQAAKKPVKNQEETFDDLDRPRKPLRVPSLSELPEWEPPRDDSGLIMLEID